MDKHTGPHLRPISMSRKTNERVRKGLLLITKQPFHNIGALILMLDDEIESR